MQSLVLYPTSLAQWHALVNEAESACSLELGEELESYLVFLLMRFVEKPEVAGSIVALDFLNSLQVAGHYRHDLLRDVGDKCLLFSGLFPELAKRRRVQPSYYIDVGQNAYYALATLSEEELIARLYGLLSEHFVSLRDVLNAVRKVPEGLPQNILRILGGNIH